jgi:hypothetical protein
VHLSFAWDAIFLCTSAAVPRPVITTGRSLVEATTTSSKARRLQRQRQSDRALITLASASQRLRKHHGSATMAPPLAATHWECRKCQCWAPRGGLAYCNQCGHAPPAGVTSLRGSGAGGASKDGKGLRKDSSQAKEKGKGKGSNDAKVLKALEAKAAAEAKAKVAEKAHKALLAEVSRLTAEAKSKEKGDVPVAMDTDTSTPALDSAVAQARDELKQMQAFSEFNRSLIPEFGGKLEFAQQKLNSALAARRAANPLKQQLENTEAHQARTSKRLQEAKDDLQGKLEALEEAQKAIDKQKSTIAEAEVAMAKVDAEVAVLAAQFASERCAAPAAEASASTPLLRSAAPAEGLVSIELVNQEWDKNQLAWMARMQQLESLLEATGGGPSASDASQSDAGDLCNLDLLEDDAAWSTVEKGKRKAVLSRQRDKLAKDVKASLAKVSATTSPFRKH